MNLKIKSLSKDIVIIFSISFLLLIFAEISFRGAKKIWGGSSNNVVFNDLVKAFDNKYSEKELRHMKSQVGDFIEYATWIQVGNKSHNYKYSNVKDGIRKTFEIEKNKGCRTTKTIWFFGGSTTYGVGTPWQNSIPSEFVKSAHKSKICVKALNFGVPTHYSLQEVIYFSSELAKNEKTKPDAAIFLDGANDFSQPLSTIKSEGLLTPFIKLSAPFNQASNLWDKFIPVNLNVKLNFRLVHYLISKINPENKYKTKIAFKNYNLPDGYNEYTTAKKIASKMQSNRIYLSKVCYAFNIKCYQFIQPVAGLYYSPLPGEKITNNGWENRPNESKRFKIGYEELDRQIIDNSLKNLQVFNISRIFSNYQNGIPYVDAGHYSPRGHKMISEEMINRISF